MKIIQKKDITYHFINTQVIAIYETKNPNEFLCLTYEIEKDKMPEYENGTLKNYPAKDMAYKPKDNVDTMLLYAEAQSNGYCFAHNNKVKQPQTPEELGLIGFIPYEDKGVKVVIKKDSYIEKDMINHFQVRKWPQIIYGENIDGILGGSFGLGEKTICACCGNTSVNNTTPFAGRCCPQCGSEMGWDWIVDKTFAEHRQKFIGQNKSRVPKSYMNKSNKYKTHTFYVRAVENGFEIYKLQLEMVLENGILTKKYSAPYTIYHIVDGEIKAYANHAKGRKECDAFEATGFNSKNITNPINAVYEGADNFLEFVMNNEKQFRRCGFIDTLKYSKEKMNIERFFFLFITISNTYPVMEQLIKAGNTKLFYNVYEDIIKQFNVESMKTALKSIEDIVDNNATTSTKALRIPQYINNYLIQKNADIKDYKHWINIYELTQLSKEQFEEVVNSFQFACVNSQVSSYTLGNILKYGYDFNKLLRYIIKQSPENDYDVPKVASTLYDYLSMCEILGVEPDKFPQNLKKQHDDIMVQFTNKKNEKQNAYICRLAEECEKWFASYDNSKNVPKEYNNYVVVFPKNINDFIEEGNKMHNCVGSYVQRVYEETCIIFFLRKKEAASESFITGEFVNSSRSLKQFYFSNNRNVQSETLKEIGEFICKRINAGINAKKIHINKN